MQKLSTLPSRFLLAGALVATSAATASAQIILNAPSSGTGISYSENFDSPAGVTGNGNFTWVDNVTIPGWFSQDPSAGLESQFPGGISATQRVYSYRFNAPGTDGNEAGTGRAFGTRTTGAGTFSFAVGLTNNTGVTLTSADISFVTSLWRTPNNSTSDSLTVGYAITNSGAWSTLTYTSVSSLSTSYEQGATGGGVNLDPNTSNLYWNRLATLTDLTWAPGQTLYIRFLDGNGAGAWGIDNFSFVTAIPEPSSFAALAGLGALGFVASRRRRRA